MNSYWLIAFIASVSAVLLAFIWIAVKISGGKSKKSDLVEEAKEDVERVFNDDFREELRNRGRLHFEKIIGENAMFLQQDLRLTTDQLNEFMKNEITKVLKQEFGKYETSINTAKEQAIESIKKTQEAIEQQRQVYEQQLKEQIEKEKSDRINKFENNMGEIINHYILEAIGSEIDLTDQLDYIFTHLEDSKQSIIEDVRSGA